MIDNLVRDLQILWKTDILIGKIWAGYMARRLGLLAFAGLIALFGLGMTNVAGLYALQTSVGFAWAAAIVACVDFAVAVVVMLLAHSSSLGRELEVVNEVREIAVASIQADAGELKLAVDTLGLEVRAAKDALVGFARHPLDSAIDKLLIPGVVALIRELRSRHEKS